MKKKTTISTIAEMKDEEKKITMLTAYDYTTAKLIEEADIDIILVGDSLGNIILGHENTLKVTMDEILYHTRAVKRGAKRSLIVSDMPFMSYQQDTKDAVRNAGRLVKKAGAEAVKVEGGREITDQVKKISEAGIPVMGHLGFTPQKIHQFGGYKTRGKSAKEAHDIFMQAKELERAGAFSIVLECIPDRLSKLITENLDVPTIGIGAGPHCDGQVLVLHDLLGLSDFSAKFVKKYAELGVQTKKSVRNFIKEVKEKKFPTSNQSYTIEEEEFKKLNNLLEKK